jgi:hypothetical protein
MSSLFLMSPSWVPLLHYRLNSRDHVRTRFQTPVVMNSVSMVKFTNSNTERNSPYTTRDIATTDMEKSTTVPMSPEARTDSHNVLLRANNVTLAYRISPKLELTVQCPPRCSHDGSPQPSYVTHFWFRVVAIPSLRLYSTFSVLMPMQSFNRKTRESGCLSRRGCPTSRLDFHAALLDEE